MAEEKAKTLASLANGVHDKKEADNKILCNSQKANNAKANIEVLWQGINLYYLQQAGDASFSEEDRKIVTENFSELLAAFEPILSVKSDEFHPEEETVI